MAEPFIFTNTTAIKEGQLEAWVKSFAEFAEDIERAEPRLLHFAMYVSEDGAEETVVQVHPDADSMLYHMGLLAEHGHASGDYLDFSRSTTRIYGEPTDELLEKIRAFSSDITTERSSPKAGFSRL